MKISKEQYLEMSDYFCKLISDIGKKQFDIYYTNKDKYSEEYVKKAKSDNEMHYWNFDKARDSARDVKKLIDLVGEDDFVYFALGNLSSAKSRIESLTEKNHEINYDEFDTHKYDDILVDYWDKIKNNVDSSKIWLKYRYITYRRTNVNFGLLDDIQNHRQLLEDSQDLTQEEKEKELLLNNKIEDLIKQLHDFIPDWGEIVHGNKKLSDL